MREFSVNFIIITFNWSYVCSFCWSWRNFCKMKKTGKRMTPKKRAWTARRTNCSKNEDEKRESENNGICWRWLLISKVPHKEQSVATLIAAPFFIMGHVNRGRPFDDSLCQRIMKLTQALMLVAMATLTAPQPKPMINNVLSSKFNIMVLKEAIAGRV